MPKKSKGQKKNVKTKRSKETTLKVKNNMFKKMSKGISSYGKTIGLMV